MLKRLDHWVAKHVFWPIIIKVCQEAKCTKWAFGRLCSWLWICAMIIVTDRWDWFSISMCAFLAIFETVSLGFLKDAPYDRSPFLRAAWWVMAALHASVGQIDRFAITVLMLFSYYAATLPDVPPKRKREEVSERGQELAEMIQ